MSSTKYIQETFEKEYSGKKDKDYNYKELNRERLLSFRNEEHAVIKIDKPTNIARAKKLGYKAKEGIIMCRVRIRKGGGKHDRPNAGRKPKRMGVTTLTRRKSIQAIAELRASEKFSNCEVLNSYFIGQDGQHKYFEIILVDVRHPAIIADRDLNWIIDSKQRGRAERGLTSAAKKSRGLLHKGKGTEKIRPSQRAHDRTAK